MARFGASSSSAAFFLKPSTTFGYSPDQRDDIDNWPLRDARSSEPRRAVRAQDSSTPIRRADRWSRSWRTCWRAITASSGPHLAGAFAVLKLRSHRGKLLLVICRRSRSPRPRCMHSGWRLIVIRVGVVRSIGSRPAASALTRWIPSTTFTDRPAVSHDTQPRDEVRVRRGTHHVEDDDWAADEQAVALEGLRRVDERTIVASIGACAAGPIGAIAAEQQDAPPSDGTGESGS